MTNKLVITATALGALALSGCASMSGDSDSLQSELNQKEQEASSLRSQVESLQASLRDKTGLSGGAASSGGLLPPNAKAGECYARVFIPATYTTEQETVVKTEASKRVNVTAPKYAMVDKRILVKEASEDVKVVPARYEWVEEKVLVREASERLEVVPAKYETRTEKVMVQPATTTWKKGRGPIERIDQATGEIMCLVEVPAVYKTVTKRVEVSPPITRRIPVPAQYDMVKKRVMVEPSKTTKTPIPAEYKMVKVREMVEAPKEVVQEIPAEYQTVEKRKLVRAGGLQWQPILCETNTTPGVVRRLQQTLKAKNYYHGPIDGVVGAQTTTALERWQADSGVARGGLTIDSLKQLDVL